MKKVIFCLLGLSATTMLWATVPVGYLPYSSAPRYPNLAADTLDPLRLRFNYLYEFSQIADFIQSWQLDDPDSVDDGGMIEAESGPLRPVIQTDNTLEAIWVWSRYGQMTGDTSKYRNNIDKARAYCERFPAWKEEGLEGQNYYRMHNCAWGIAAEQMYRDVYADDGWTWYRDSCGIYMKTHKLNKWQILDRQVMGWCAGWLYKFGVETGDQVAIDTACVMADSLIAFTEFKTPQVMLTDEYWAMSAGTIVWGICNSAFRLDSMRGKEWIIENGPYLDTFQVWRSIPNDYGWDNSWNVGYANGHGAMHDISRNPEYARRHLWLTNKLLSYDTDSDGGIMASTQDSPDVDMCWVSSYLCMMGLDRLIGEVEDKDAGVLEIAGIRDGDTIKKGTKVDLKAIVTNYGREPLTSISVNLSGDAAGSWATDLGFLESDTILMKSNWVVPETAILVLTTSHPEDMNHTNDTLRVGINCFARPGVREEATVQNCMKLEIPQIASKSIIVKYEIPPTTKGSLALYDIKGALINKFYLCRSTGQIDWNVSELPKGVYFARLESNEAAINRRVLLLR